MPGVTEEEIQRAREMDILTYLEANEPHELLRSRNGEYRTVTHSSLVISKGLWIWNRTGIGGRSALDFLINVRGMGFVEAVKTVCEARTAPSSSPLPEGGRKNSNARSDLPLGGAQLILLGQLAPAADTVPTQSPKQLVLPRISNSGIAVIRYLQERGISSEVIKRCLQAGMLYESRYRNEPVCVFVGRDEVGKARFACMRGVRSSLKQDCSGSDKRYSFCYPGEPGSRHLACFEAPIDALSHATLQQRNGWKWDGHRLSLGGTSHVALIAYLERNPQITRIMLHLDNDAAGLRNARKIKSVLATDKRFSCILVSINPPHQGKDYNDTLLLAIRQEWKQKQVGLHREAGILL